MSVFKRGKVWNYEFMIRGVRYRGRFPTARSYKAAKDLEADTRLSVLDGTYGKPKGERAFVDYVEKVFLPWSDENKRSSSDDHYHAKTFKAFFGDKTFSEITPLLLEKYKRERRSGLTKYERQRSAASVNRELELLSKIFNLAIRDKETAINPCRQVQSYPEENERVRYLSTEEEARLMAQLSGRRAHLKPLVLMAIKTGMRRQELLDRDWSDIDFGLNVIRIRRSKNGRARAVPMSESVRELLLAMRPAKPAGPVFVRPRTKRRLTEPKKAFRA